MNKICFGCGAKLQCDDKNKIGYVPENKIKDAVYCMRCFRMQHYGESSIVNTPKEKKEIINKINKDNKFVLFLVDFLNINEEIIDVFKSIKKDKLLIVNKCELIPKNISKVSVGKFIKNYYHINSDIKLKGGTLKHGAKSILNYLEERNIKEAYIIGLSNSGKSTLINDLIDINKSSMNKITISKKSNTTLDFIRVKINENLTLIDSPGFLIDNSLNHDVFDSKITAYSFNIKAGETLRLLDQKYFIKFDEDTKIVLYTNAICKEVIKKHFKAADGLINKIVINDNEDLIINGIGFMKIKNKTNITTNIEKNNLSVRKSMFGGYYE